MTDGKHVAKRIFIVACHAIYRDGPIDSDKSWFLLSYQQGNGHVARFLQHIEYGLRRLSEEPDSLLVFSGGVTRDGANTSEAASYLRAARQMQLYDDSFADRILLEEYARDSYENLLYGTACAYSHTRTQPELLAVVGFAFKTRRFHYHAKCIGLDPEEASGGRLPAFSYFGVNDPQEMDGPNRGEALALEQFTNDPHGVASALADKRKSRNPQNRRPDYHNTTADWPMLAGVIDLNLSTY